MEVSRETMERMGCAMFVERMVDMLFASGAIDPDNDREVVGTHVARVLDEADAHGIKTERLMGMYVILRLADGVDPYAVPEYAAVLDDPTMEEADKAHVIQMIRIGEL